MGDMDPSLGVAPVTPTTISRDDMDQLMRQRDMYRNMQISSGMDGDADQAAHSQELGETSGVPAPLIAGNYDEFVAQQKVQTAQKIAARNPDIDAYIMSNPLASTVSNDDWANLDKFTRESQAPGALRPWVNATKSPVADAVGDIAEAGLKGAWEGLMQGGVQPTDAELKLMDSARNPAGVVGAAATKAGFGALDIGQRIMSALGGGVEGAAVSAGGKLGFEEPESRRIVEAVMNQGMAEAGMHMHPSEPAPAPKPQTALDVARPYTSAGEEPPTGLHPEIDAAKAKVNAQYVDSLATDLKNAIGTETRERSPTTFEGLTQRMYGDSDIGIHADAVLALYGDKPSAPDDGLLGWVPNIETQLQAARETGTDVQIPMSGWMAKVDPEVAKNLQDDIRVWPGGVTAREATALPTDAKALVEEPLPTVRAASGLEPKFSVGDRKLTLVAGATEAGDQFHPEVHNFDLHDENGQPVGNLEIIPGPDKKTLYVNGIYGQAGLWANSFGPALIRDVKRQLKTIYPDYEYLTGHRVSGAREGVNNFGPMPVPRVRLEAGGGDLVKDYHDSLDVLQHGWQDIGAGVEVNRQPSGFHTHEELARNQATIDEVRRLAGSGPNVEGVAGIQDKVNPAQIHGLYVPKTDAPPDILTNMLGPDQLGVGRHEAVHYLKDYGLFSDDEWGTLVSAAQSEGWQDRYDIHSRYAGLDDNSKIEESIADAFREWAGQPENTRPKTGVGAIFQKLWDFLDRIRQGMGKYLGREPTWDDVFKRVNQGEVGARDIGEPENAGQFRFSRDEAEQQQQAIVEGITNLQASTVGMDAERFQKLKGLIQTRAEEDLRKTQAVLEKEQARRQTREWKSNSSDMAKEVSAEIRNRPDVASDLFIGSGEFYGKKLQQRFTLAEDSLTDVQKAALPEHYVSKNGLNPDAVAGLFGYSSGDEMVNKLGALEQLKTGADGKRMRSEDFIRGLVKTETERRMEMRYGDLGANILDAAKDQALSDSSVNVQYEEYRAVAESQGSVVFDKAVAVQAAKNLLADMPIGKVSSYRAMQDMGRDSRNAEKAMTDGNWADAAVHMQRQTMNMILAKEAKALEKRVADFDKTAKRWAKRDQPSVPPEYGHWVHDILQRVGKPVRMDAGDLARQLREDTTATSLQDFVKDKAGDLSALDVSDEVLDPSFKKAYKDLTTAEFDGVKASVDTLIATGRRELKVYAQGKEFDRAGVVAELAETLKQFPVTSVADQRAQSIISRLPRQFLNRAIQAETTFGRWDSFDPWGPWTQKVFRDLKDGDNQADAWRKEFAGKLEEAGEGSTIDMSKAIQNTLFREPKEFGGNLVPMNHEGLLAVMLNLGSESNIKKISKGWGVAPEMVEAFVKAHATKEHWDFAQKIWDIFGELKGKSDTMYRSMGRIAPKTVEARPLENDFGKYRGGYYPVVYDRTYGRIPKIESGSGLMQDGYTAAEPPAGYTVARKNFFQPTALDLQSLPSRLNQIIHDTAMRPSVENFGKLMFDPKIKAAITVHYGADTYKVMTDYIKGVANRANTGVQLWKDGAAVADYFRENMMAGLVGLNPGTIMKHGTTAAVLSAAEVGPKDFARAVRSLHSVNDETSESNYQFAMRNSLELQRRTRNAQETLSGQVGQLTGTPVAKVAGINVGPTVTKFLPFRQQLQEFASKPLAFSDLLSAVPTWLAAYDKAMEDGTRGETAHGDAVFLADRAVRNAHGSTAITSRPMLMNQLSPWVTTFYNFFNTVFNRQVETLWKAGEAAGLAKEGNYSAAMKAAAGVGAGVFAYSIWPAVTESWVSPQESKPDDSWAKRAAKGVAYTEGATLPVVRDITNYFLGGRSPDVGMLSTAAKSATDVFGDFAKEQPMSPGHTQKLIRDGGEFGALLAGVPEQISREAEFVYGVAKGIEHPRGPWGWMVGARYGTTKGHSQTGGQYLQGQYDRRR